ncbi:MAG: hypothetical protein CFE62_004760 [Candidatus Aquirickettsiella gammari]|uniref:Uncharacterized protein n=1 Tax=Candidatus Aquirickettsiella gammari TaxID=2016198 RepID=A0A370CIR8_9COXI|nr:MAG: hypothetical protein CFE62_004760 [Candidatus Aquirickettsiella gammari]
MPTHLTEIKEMIEQQEKSSVNQKGETTAEIEYLAVDHAPKKEEDSMKVNKKDERVFVYFESKKEGLLTVKKCSVKEYEKHANSKVIKLAFFVKNSESEDFLNKCKEKLKELSVDLKGNTAIVNGLKNCFQNSSAYSFEVFQDYRSTKHAFDENTGLSISTVLTDLKSIIDKADSYSARSESLAGISKNLSKLKVQYKKSTSTDDFSALLAALNSSKPMLDSEIARLNTGDELDRFKVKINQLKKKLEEICPKSGLFSGEIHDEGTKVTNDIKTLTSFMKAKIQENSTTQATDILTIVNLDKLEREYGKLVNRVNVLEETINNSIRKQAEEAIKSVVCKENSLIRRVEMLEFYFKEIGTACLAIENYKSSSGIKNEILGKIIADTRQLESEIKGGASREGIQEKVSEIRSYISSSIDKLNKNNGISFLLQYATSGKLAGELASKLDSFLLKFQVSSEQTVDFEASSTQQIQPKP